DDGPEYDAKLEALLPVLSREVPAHFHAHRADDIATALRISREFGLRPVIVHGTEGHLLCDLLEQEQVPVITGPCLTDRSKPELAGMTLETPALLAQHTLVAICTDHPETPIQYLPLCAAMAVRGGMSESDALAAITLNPAKILGIEDRVGSITPGKDADLAVFSAHPFDWKSRGPEQVYLNGEPLL
ncbi:MAG: amidohydrolase family protein, partial [Oscillospiraceae bacterium]